MILFVIGLNLKHGNKTTHKRFAKKNILKQLGLLNEHIYNCL